MSAHHDPETPHDHDAPNEKGGGPHGDDVLNTVNALHGRLAGMGRPDGADATRGVEEWEAALEARERVMFEREQALARERAAIKAHKHELRDAQQEMQQASDDLLERAAAFNRDKAEFDRQRQEHEGALRKKREEIEAEGKRRRAEFDRRVEEETASLRVAMEEELSARTETLKAEIVRQRERIGEREREIEQRVVELEARAVEIEARGRELSERDNQRVAELERERAERERAATHAEREVEAMRAQMETFRQEAQGAVDARAELERLRVRLDNAEDREVELQRELASTREAADAKTFETDALRDQLAQRDERIAELERASADEGGRAEIAQAFQERLEEREAQIGALEAALAEAERRARDAGGATDERLAALEAELAEREGAIADLRSQLESASAGVSAGAAQDIEKRDRAIEKLANRLEKVQKERDALAERAQAQPEAPEGAFLDAHLARRRERLTAYRRMVEAESKKIGQAKRVVAQRNAEAEKVLQHRRAVAETRQALEKAQARVAKQAKRYNATRLMLMLVTAMGALAFGSWHVARMVPVDYLAHATLRAEPVGGAALSDEQLQAWRQYVGGLVTDPRLVELAADRMKRRGLAQYASAPALGAKINDDLDFTFPSPNMMTLTLKGAGDLPTQRTLETYLATMISLANDARLQRADQANTNVASMPRAEDDPLDQKRLLMTAGGLFGAGSLVLLTFGIWGVAVFSRVTAKVRVDDTAAVRSAFEWSGAEGA